MNEEPTPPVRLMVLTDRRMASEAGHDLEEVVVAASSSGATAVVLREKDLAPADRRTLAERLRAATAARGVALVVAGDLALAAAVGADGVHLGASDPWPDAAARGALGRAAPGRALVGRSCHSLAEVRASAEPGRADYVTYSPVFATASKPGYGPALGLEGLAVGRAALAGGGGPVRSAVRRLRRGWTGTGGPAPAGPVGLVALGGIGPGRVGACRRAGADGVALMGEVMRAADPAAVVAAVAAEARQAADRSSSERSSSDRAPGRSPRRSPGEGGGAGG